VRIRDYVQVVLRNWLLVVATVAVGVGAAAILAVSLPTNYRAEAHVVFSGHAETSGQDLAYAGAYVQGRMQTYKKLGSADSVVRTARNRLGTSESIQNLNDRTDVDVSQLSTVATVSATDPMAAGAARTANTMAQALIDGVGELEGNNAAHPRTGKSGKATVEGVIVGTATPPSSPGGPKLWLYLVAGLSVGLIVSVGVVAVREALKGEPEVAEAP
jgi:capsular polysaccharide biosynthesis protein